MPISDDDAISELCGETPAAIVVAKNAPAERLAYIAITGNTPKSPEIMYYSISISLMKTRNPNAVPMGTKFGFLNGGGAGDVMLEHPSAPLFSTPSKAPSMFPGVKAFERILNMQNALASREKLLDTVTAALKNNASHILEMFALAGKSLVQAQS